MKKIITAISVAMFSVSCTAQEINYPSGLDNCTVELNGDSVLFGYVTNNTTWRLDTTPAQWLRNHGYQVEDKTAGGLRTHDLVHGYLQPFPDAWSALYPNGAQPAFWNLPHDSKIIVFQTGINDFKDPFNPSQVYQDYSYMVDHVRSLGKIPVITGVTQVDKNAVGQEVFDKIEKIRNTIKLVVKNKNVHYASFENVPVAWTDGYHLNQDSSNGVTENLRYVLSVICGVKFK